MNRVSDTLSTLRRVTGAAVRILRCTIDAAAVVGLRLVPPVSAANDELCRQCALAGRRAQSSTAAAIERDAAPGAHVELAQPPRRNGARDRAQGTDIDLAQVLLDAGADVNVAARQRHHAADGGGVRRPHGNGQRCCSTGAPRSTRIDRLKQERDDLRGRRRPHRRSCKLLLARGRRSQRGLQQRPDRADVGGGVRQGRRRCGRCSTRARDRPQGQSRQDGARHRAREQRSPRQSTVLESASRGKAS